MEDFASIAPMTKKFFDDSGAINFSAVGSFLTVAIWGIFVAKAQ
jgi:hypothetical protein